MSTPDPTPDEASSASGVTPELDANLRVWLARGLEDDRHARLDGAPVDPAMRALLAHVFTDIPVERDESDRGRGALEVLLREAGVGSVVGRFRVGAEERVGAPTKRYVVVGGPGQGKSTVVQQLAQVHRAHLLASYREKLDAVAQHTLDNVVAQTQRSPWGKPTTARLPFVIPLSALSRWRTMKREGAGILEFLVEGMADLGASLSRDSLAALLRRQPSLLLLDGLDEVPAAAGRRETLALVEEGVRALDDAPIVLVGTTRPGGYHGEFGEARELHLREFDRTTALAYAERLIGEWFPEETSAPRQLVERIRGASIAPHTARLLGTPLHVSILTALLHRSPVVPRERWQLFHDFFDAIYTREVNPQRPHAELLGRYKRYVIAVHHRAGLHLQALGETAEGAEALLTPQELARIIDARLVEDGFSEEKRRALVAQILEAANDRLVLLAHVRDGYFGFSLRSIQEFMAAEALTSGSPADVEKRLQALASLPYWRNVVLLAASKALSPVQPFAPDVDRFVAGLCDAARAAAPPGEDAMLAADLLQEGSASISPRVMDTIITRALQALDQPDRDYAERLGRSLATLASGDTAEHVEAAVRPELERRMRDAAWETRVPAWTALLALADRQVSWAANLAAERWPSGPQDRRELAQALRTRSWTNQPWLNAQIACDPETFSPRETYRVPGEMMTRHPLLVHAIARAGSWAVNVTVPLGETFAWVIGDLRRAASSPAELAEISRFSAWRVTYQVALFSSTPSSSTLADVLAWFADHVPLAEWQLHAQDAPWPIAACLLWAESAEGLRALAAAAGSGELGEATDWLTAETRWRERGVAADELSATGRALPWSPTIASRGFVPWAARLSGAASYYDSDARRSRHEAVEELGHALTREFSSRSRASTRWIAEVLRRFAELFDTPDVRIAVSDLHRVARAETLPLSAALKFTPPDEDDALVAMFDESQARFDVDPFVEIDRVNALLATHPSSPGLIHLAARLLPRGEELGPVVVPDATWAAADTLAPLDRAALAVLEFAFNRPVDAPLLAAAILQDEPSIGSALSVAAELPERGAQLAAALLARLDPSRRDLRARCHEVLLAEHARRRSELLVPSVWSDLALPRPSPPEPAGTEHVWPVRVAGVSIRNLRVLSEIDLDLAADGDDRSVALEDDGQWVVLLGENGVGKSTVLRTITLALVEPDYATALFTESAERAGWRSAGAATGSARVDLGGQTHTVTVDVSDTGRETLRATSDPPNGSARERPFVVAYGCRRGAADGGRDQKVAVEPLDGLGTLFDLPGRALVIAEAWLKDLALAQLQNEPGSAHLYDVVVEALIGSRQVNGSWRDGVLPGVRAMTIREGKVWFEGPEVGRAPLAGLSDGYITTLGWVVDLMARWIAHRRKRKEHVSRGFLREMRGVVLLDEIDLHLHPRWQKELIPIIRKVFPKLSFVVTTHNPLTVIGAREGEVFVLRRLRGSSRVEARRLSLPVGLRADQVLTGEWFGLATTLDPETFELWERHYRALRGGAKAGDPSVVELEAELRKRLGTYASTSLERIALDVAAEVMGDAPQKLTASERDVARARILAWTKARSGD